MAFRQKSLPKKTNTQKSKAAMNRVDGFSTEKSPPKTNTPKNQKRLLIVSAFDWDGMGGNIGGLSVYVLALMIMYYPLVDWQWIESELPVTHKVAPKQSNLSSMLQETAGKSNAESGLKYAKVRGFYRDLK